MISVEVKKIKRMGLSFWQVWVQSTLVSELNSQEEADLYVSNFSKGRPALTIANRSLGRVRAK